MRNCISRFKSPTLVNAQLCWEDARPHCRDCHDPPHATGLGFHDVKSPPRSLAEVARSDPWSKPLAGVAFPRDATRRRRLPGLFGLTTGAPIVTKIAFAGIGVAKMGISSSQA
jgi:hypothetical protein